MMFAHALALRLGQPDVDAMLDAMRPDQFLSWAAFFTAESKSPRKSQAPDQHRAVLEQLTQNGR